MTSRFRGRVYSTYNVVKDGWQVEFMGEYKEFPASMPVPQLETAVDAWCETVLQSKGMSHGLSGQSPQAVSGNPYQSQLGNSPLGQQSAHQAAIQAQLAQHAVSQQYAQHVASLQNVLSTASFGAYPQGKTESSPEPLKTEAIKIGELTGWRGWKVTPQGFLKSMSADVLWAPGEPMDGNTKSREEHNGVYAYKKCRDFLKQHEHSGLDVYGTVALWGDIIEHELGYRAEWAKITSLEGTLSKVSLGKLRERYGV